MSSPTIDYDALAQQHGGTVAPSGGVDYDALATQSGGEVAHDPQNPGAFKRFAARALGIPEDVLSHPNKWLNPFSKEYNSPEHKQEQAAMTPGEVPQSAKELIPGHQTYQDVKSGNYAGATGDILSTIMQLGQLAQFGGRAPVEVPNVYEGPIPPEIPAGKPTGSIDLSGLKPLLQREAMSKVPGYSRITGEHAPSPKEYIDALLNRKPATEQPVYGNVSNAESRGPFQPYQGDLTVKPEIAPASAGQNPVPQEAAPALNQNGGELTRLPSQSTLSGESALRQVLTGQDNANLMRIAKSRGINVTKEAQLKPGVADRLLVNKIIDDFSPDELDEVGAKFTEASRFKHNFGDVGSEAWKSMSMQTYFPDVKLPAAMVARVNKAIANAAQTNAPVSAIPPKAMAQAAAAGATMPAELSQPSISDALRASLAQRGIIVDANGNIVKKP